MQISVTEWLDNSAKLYPDNIALVDSTTSVTYSQYRKQSLAVARKIIETSNETELPVVVYIEKSVHVPIAFLGIAYSRNFYTLIDDEMPKQRVDKILEVLDPKIVITTSDLKERFESFNFKGEYILYDKIQPQDDDEQIVAPRSAQILDTDLLYVLFTSGSTGTPKGVGITHRSVIDFADWGVKEFGMNSTDSLGSLSPFYFDATIFVVYVCMQAAAKIYIIPKDYATNPEKLITYVKENQINNLKMVPTMMIMIARMRVLRKIDLTGILRRVFFGGEAMTTKELNEWRKYLPDVVYSNFYGPTEATGNCTFYTVNREFSNEDSLPIGKPMANTEILLLDEQDKLIPPSVKDVEGEICVRGTSLAVGYYNNPEKTREAFVQNPLHNRYEEKIYRTGDLGFYNEYQELMFSGRKDFMIKHLGYRVELGEIETAVTSFEDVDRCCCAYDKKHSRIVLFVVSKTEMNRQIIHDRLEKMIPEYMIPEVVKQLDEMPLNVNGKIDRVKIKEMV